MRQFLMHGAKSFCRIFQSYTSYPYFSIVSLSLPKPNVPFLYR